MASKATITSINDSSTAAQALATANPDRTGLLITNYSTAGALLVALNGTASAANHSWQVPINGSVNLSDISGRCWKGDVSGIWVAAGSGAAKVTELE